MRPAVISNKWWIAVKWALSLVALAYIACLFTGKDGLVAQFAMIKLRAAGNWFIFPLLLTGMAVNWLLESFKWYLVQQKTEKLSLVTACKAVLSGVAVGIFTPNRIGEYAGRLWYAKDKVSAVVQTVAANMCQLTATLVFGIAAWYVFPVTLPFKPVVSWKFMFIPVAVLLMGILPFFRKWISTFWLKIKEVLSQISFRLWLSLLVLSMLRYIAFALPFAWLLSVFCQQPVSVCLLVVPLTYLLQTLIPGIAVADAGIRGFSISTVAGFLGWSATPAVLAALLIWLVNVVIPAMAGAVLLFFHKQQIKA